MDYKLTRSKRKTIALIVPAFNQLEVRAPLRLSEREIERFVLEKEVWIRGMWQKLAHRPIATKHAFRSGEQFLYLGQALVLKHSSGGRVKIQDDNLLLPEKYLASAKDLVEKWYRRRAREMFEKRVSWFAPRLGVKVNQVKLSSANGRWGSASSKGYINLNWRLIMAPLTVIDYVVVHELAHLIQANHSPLFWREVEKILPEYKKERKWLKINGALLEW